jgi:hypothetical protein
MGGSARSPIFVGSMKIVMRPSMAGGRGLVAWRSQTLVASKCLRGRPEAREAEPLQKIEILVGREIGTACALRQPRICPEPDGAAHVFGEVGEPELHALARGTPIVRIVRILLRNIQSLPFWIAMLLPRLAASSITGGSVRSQCATS